MRVNVVPETMAGHRSAHVPEHTPDQGVMFALLNADRGHNEAAAARLEKAAE